MQALVTRWRRTAVVGLVTCGVAVGSALAAVPAHAAPAHAAPAHATPAKNLLSNGSAEAVNRKVPRGWSKGGVGVNTRMLTVGTKGAQLGRKFVRTKITKYRTGAAWWYTPAAAVKGGSTYTYTEFYRSNGRTTVNAYFTVGRRTVGKRVAVLPASGRWKAIRYTVTAPAGATKARFGHALTSAGYVDVDNISLVRASASPAAAKVTSAKGLVSLTFDDGWINQATNAAPIMKAANLPGTFYLISGYLGSGEYMSVAQAKQLQAFGSEIGSHSVSHVNLVKATPATLAHELGTSKSALEANFGPVTSFAYPFGTVDAKVQAATAKYYTNARSTNPGNNVRGQYNKHSLSIGYVLNTTPLSTVQRWINEAQANNSWLILCYHRIANDQPSDLYTASVSNFQAQVKAIKASGVKVVTVRDGIKLTS